MGPGDGISRQKLIDLTMGLADQISEPNAYGATAPTPQPRVRLFLVADISRIYFASF